MSKVFLRSLLFAGLCACTLGLAAPAQASVILSNLPGTGVPGSGLGFGFDGVDRTKAVGLTVGANDLSFTSLTGLFRNNAGVGAAVVTGGIFSDAGGNPGAQLVAFNPGSVAAGASAVLETLTAVGPFTLMANTSYWFLLDGPAIESFLVWDTPNAAPTPSAEVASFDGYRFSSNGGASWSNSLIFNGVQIEASRLTSLPEPGTLVLFGLGLLGLGIARRRQRA